MKLINKLRNKKELKRYFRRTKENKFISVNLIGLGILSAILSGGEATFLVFTLAIGLPLFFDDEQNKKES